MDNNELMHHGTKGMHWGIRRYQNKDGSLTPAGEKRYASQKARYEAEKAKYTEKRRTLANKMETKAKKNEIKDLKKEAAEEKQKYKSEKKSVKDMSNEELQAAINRIQLERRYSELTAKQTSRGKKFVMDVLEASGKSVAKDLTTYAMGSAVNKIAGQDIINTKKQKKKKDDD